MEVDSFLTAGFPYRGIDRQTGRQSNGLIGCPQNTPIVDRGREMDRLQQ